MPSWHISGTNEYWTIGHLLVLADRLLIRYHVKFVMPLCSYCSSLMSYVRRPRGREIQMNIDWFERMCVFPRVAGTIDGTDVEIRGYRECPEDYVS